MFLADQGFDPPKEDLWQDGTVPYNSEQEFIFFADQEIHMKKIYDKLAWWLRDNEQGFVFLTDEGFDQYEGHLEADHSAQILITVWASSAF